MSAGFLERENEISAYSAAWPSYCGKISYDGIKYEVTALADHAAEGLSIYTYVTCEKLYLLAPII